MRLTEELKSTQADKEESLRAASATTQEKNDAIRILQEDVAEHEVIFTAMKVIILTIT